MGWSGVSGTGLAVNSLTALQASTVYGCVKCLAEDVAKLPVRVYRRLARGGQEIDSGHELNPLFRQPNRWQTAFDFWRYVVTSLVLRGNGYAAILRDGTGRPRALVPLNPDKVTVLVSPKGWIYYLVSHPLVGDGITMHQDDMLHLRGMSLDGGITGVSPIAFAQDSIGIALATQRHGAKLFSNGAQIGGVLETDATLSPEAAARIGSSWSATYGGVENSHKVAVLEQGLKFSKVAMTSQDAQFLETRKYSGVDICRIFRVPPHKVMDLERATFSNIENQNQQYIDDALLPIGGVAEQAIERNLLFEDERDRITVAFDFNALLRGDMKTRYDAYAIGLMNGFRSTNEVRIAEGLAPVAGGDEFRVPLNLGSTTPTPSPAPAPADA